MKKNTLSFFIAFLIISITNAQNYDFVEKVYPGDGAEDDRFGYSVSVSENFIFSGAHYDDDDGMQSGSVYVWKFDGSDWNYLEKLTAGLNGAADDKFGNSVSVSGNHAVVGAWGDDDEGSWTGSVYISL